MLLIMCPICIAECMSCTYVGIWLICMWGWYMYVRMRSAPLISHTDAHPTQWIRALYVWLIRMPYMYLPRAFLMCMPYVCRWRAHLIHYRGILEEIHDCWQWVELSKKFILRHGTCKDDPSRSNTTITCDPTTLTYTDILPHLRRLTGYESFTFGTTVSTFRNGMRCHQQLQMSHPQRKQASLLIHRPSSNTRLTVLSRLWLALYTS